MKSIGARLTLYYAIAATLTAAMLFVAGYILLETRLIRGLDALNAAEFHQLEVRLGTDYASLTPKVINERIRDSADAASALFYINIDEPKTGMVFYSRNLHRHPIPDVKGSHVYGVEMPDVGELRVGEFVMPPFDVTIATPMAQVREGLRSYVEICFGLLVAMLLVSIAIGMGLSRLILKPINFIRETANRISSDNLSERIPLSANNDELTDLTRLLNQMFDRLEVSFTQIKRFAADASHELKTPLSLIKLHGEKLLEDGKLHSEGVDAVLVQLEEVARLNQIIEEMLFLSRAEAHTVKLALKPQNTLPILESFEQDAHVLAEHRCQRFEFVRHGDGIVAYEARWLRQIWLNLLTNALNASPPDGLVTMSSSFDDKVWRVVVEDEGPGVLPTQVNEIFERFTQFGSPEHRAGGSGLGLAICRSIAMLHGGEIGAANRKDRSGLRVTVTLPLVAAYHPHAAPRVKTITRAARPA